MPLEGASGSGEWQYILDGTQKVARSSEELQNLANLGVLKPADLVWFEGLEEWRPAHKVAWLEFPEVSLS